MRPGRKLNERNPANNSNGIFIRNIFINNNMKPRRKEINDFLKSRRGLAYLSMKYPKLSLSDAIREYKASVAMN